MIAKNHIHFGLAVFEAMHGIELRSQVPWQVSVCIARERYAEAPAQHFFISGHPLHP